MILLFKEANAIRQMSHSLFNQLFQCTERQGKSTDSNARVAEKSFRVKGKETQKVRGVTHTAENCQKTYPISS